MLLGATYRFSAAMQLGDYDGLCQNFHGYDFKLRALARVPIAVDLSLDVVDLDRWFQTHVVDILHRSQLNQHITYPSLEGTILWIAERAFPAWLPLESLELTAADRYWAVLTREEWRRRIEAS